MRVSTRSAYLNGLAAIQQLQASLDRTQRQISSGRRILTPSDDPIAASRSLELREALSRLQQFGRNSTVVTNRLSQEESALAAVNNVLQRVRELALQGSNATQSNESRKFIAIEMREHLGNLEQLANQKDGNGGYLFAGNLENTQPVSRMGSTFTYNGDQGQRFIQIGEGRQVADSDPGSAVFFQIRSGNGEFATAAAAANTGTGVIGASSVIDPTLYDQDEYTIRFADPDNYDVFDSSGGLVASGAYVSGDTIAFRGIEFTLAGEPAAADEFIASPSPFQDLFSMVQNLANALETSSNSPESRAAMANQVNAGIMNMDQALGHILDVRTQVGSRLAAIEDQVDSNGSFALAMQTALAEIEDLDYAEAISRLSAETTTLEAAQKSFVITQRLSLFNLL